MKKFIYSFIAMSLLLSSCGGDDDENEPSGAGLDRSKIEKGNYSENESSTDTYLRIMTSLTSYQGTANSSSSTDDISSFSGRTSSEFEFDICQFYNLNSGQQTETCFEQTVVCEDEGAKITTTSDYKDGCDAGDQVLAGKLIYTIYGLDKIFDFENESADFDFNSDYEFINFGEISSPKISGKGSQVTTSDIDGNSVTTTKATYTLFAANEDLELELDHKNIISTFGDLTSEYTYSGSSNNNYTIDVVASDVVYSSSCSINQETVETFFPTSGKENVTIVKNGNTKKITVDFGDGTCDDLITVTDQSTGDVSIVNSLYELVQ